MRAKAIRDTGGYDDLDKYSKEFKIGTRRSPVRAVLGTIIFPGFVFYYAEDKIKGLLLSALTYGLYMFKGFGIFLHLYFLFIAWGSIMDYNASLGYSALEPQEVRIALSSKTMVAAVGHPLYVFIAFRLAVTFNMGRDIGDDSYQVNGFAYIFFLMLLFVIRFQTYRLLRGNQLNQTLPEILDEFGANHRIMFFTLPLFLLMFIPISVTILQDVLVNLFFIAIITFGPITFSNNLYDIRLARQKPQSSTE